MNRIKSSIKTSNHRVRKSSRGKLLTISAYVSVFAIVMVLVATNIQPPKTEEQKSAAAQQNISANFTASSKLPVVTSAEAQTANIASVIASSSNLNASDSATNRSISMNYIIETAQTSVSSANKSTSVNSVTGATPITPYIAKDGDNVAVIASKFGISDQTVRQANNISGDDVTPGTTLDIPAVDGVVYTIVDGDSLDSVASKYSSSVDSIVAVNNLTSNDAPAGTKILLPDGKVPVAPVNNVATSRTNTVNSTTLATRATGSGKTSVTGRASRYSTSPGNTYYYGQCTWYAFERRAELGLDVRGRWGNANTWATRARAAGFIVNHTPSVGAIFQTTGGYYGHVGVVESINADGTITISEMNYSGWSVINMRVISNPGSYNYIH